jgi:hypothetical protein
MNLLRAASGIESREYGRRDPSRWPQKLELISPTSGGRSVGIVRSRTRATEFLLGAARSQTGINVSEGPNVFIFRTDE